jgi:MFS family permease
MVQYLVALLAVTAQAGTRPTATYRALALDASNFEVGLVQSAYSVLPALIAIFVGRWVDRLGEVRTYAGALLLMGVGMLLSAMAGDLATLALGQAAIGFGTTSMLVAGQVMISSRSRQEHWNRDYGNYSAAISIGTLIGPSLAASILAAPVFGPEPERAVFLASLIIVVSAAGFIALLPERVAATAAEGAPAQEPFFRVLGAIVRRPGVASAMFVSIVVISTIDILVAYLPVFGEVSGLPVQLVGLLLSIRAASTLASRLFMTQLLRRFGWGTTLVSSLAMAAASLALVPMTTEPVLLVVLMAACGFGIGLGQPMSVTWIASRTSKAERSTALSARLGANRASLLFVPAVMGAVAGSAGVAVVFVIMGIVLELGAWATHRAKLGPVAGDGSAA